MIKAQAPASRDAVKKFLEDCEARKLGWETMRKYRHLLEDRFLLWTEQRGFHNPRQINVDARRQFRQGWKDGPLYASKDLERMRAFFGFCHQQVGSRTTPRRP